MRRHLLVTVPVLMGMALAGCTGTTASSATHRAAAAAPPVTGPAGSPGNPQVFSCREESFLRGSMPKLPEPGDLAVGPLVIIGGQKLATADPAVWGQHGSYKLPFVVTMGSTVTVTINAPARGHVVIDSPYASGVTAATYRPCPGQLGFFAQSFAFTDGRIRGCVPLDVRAGGEPRVRRVTLSLFAGACSG
jgi:hypothetical protein